MATVEAWHPVVLLPEELTPLPRVDRALPVLTLFAGLLGRRHERYKIAGLLAAEVLDLKDGDASDRVRAEAALGDALWAVIVPPDRYAEACAAALESGHRWPIAKAGIGRPRGVLAAVAGPEVCGSLLTSSDSAPATSAQEALGYAATGLEAVAPDGMRYGPVLSRLQAPERPVLGRRAREARITELRLEVRQLSSEATTLEQQLSNLHQILRRARDVLDAVEELGPLEEALHQVREGLAQAERQRAPLAERQTALVEEVSEHGQAAGAAGEAATTAEREERRLEAHLPSAEQELEQLRRIIKRQERELAAQALSPPQRAALETSDLPSVDRLERDRKRLEEEIGDLARFPEDVRDELIVDQRDKHRQTVADAEGLLTGRQEALDDQQMQVDEARRRYDDHVRAVVRLLNDEFARICEAAGVDGEVRLIPGERPDEFGFDVLVAHRRGERRRSYRDASHSGGQRTKIAILLLLAATGLGGAADLLVMDEHNAHLDSTNIDHIAGLMASLCDRVQFLLAAPTNAEAGRLGWCDLQLAFLPRKDGEPFSPSVRLLSRMGTEDLERRFEPSQRKPS
jgi:hypothetical protein